MRRTRRYEKGRHGQRIDLRRTLRGSLRTGGDPIRLARRRRRVAAAPARDAVRHLGLDGAVRPRLPAVPDVGRRAAGRTPRRSSFATRLTRLTRALASRNPERAIQRAAAAAPDWSSGTRIGDALKAFNDRHGRRGMARGAVVVILSDGWERGDPSSSAREMAAAGAARAPDRVGQPARRRDGVRGARRRHGRRAAALRRARQRPQLRALGEVVEAIGGASGSAPCPTVEPGGDEEPSRGRARRRSPGSSVAMPSGHGPSRGNTTPGWVTR